MRSGRCSWIAGFVVLAALTAGCSSEQSESPAAPAPTAAPSSAPTSPEPSESPDPYAIPENPADIDEAYVERVLEALSESTAAAAREIAREGRVTAAARTELATAHRGPALAGILRAFRRAVRTGEPHRFFSAQATAVDVTVDEILSADRACIFALVTEDTNSLGGQEVEPFPTYYHLGLKETGDDPAGRNPTPWMIEGDGPPLPKGKEYEDPCK